MLSKPAWVYTLGLATTLTLGTSRPADATSIVLGSVQISIRAWQHGVNGTGGGWNGGDIDLIAGDIVLFDSFFSPFVWYPPYTVVATATASTDAAFASFVALLTNGDGDYITLRVTGTQQAPPTVFHYEQFFHDGFCATDLEPSCLGQDFRGFVIDSVTIEVLHFATPHPMFGYLEFDARVSVEGHPFLSPLLRSYSRLEALRSSRVGIYDRHGRTPQPKATRDE